MSASDTRAEPTVTEPGQRLLTVDGLTVSVGGLTLLDGVGLTIDAGETLGLIGETGSGKSLTSRAIIGLLPTAMDVSGSVVWRGQELLTASAAQRRRLRGTEISMIFQDPMSSLNPTMKIGRQVGEVLRRRGVPAAEVQRRVIEMLDRVGIPEPQRRIGNYPHEFSGGMRQRAMIAMAMITGPSLVLADEPTTALDVTVQARVLEMLRQVRADQGSAMLFVSHDLRVISHVADRVSVMYAGSIMEQGPTVEVLRRPAHPYTRALVASVPAVRTRTAIADPLPGAPATPADRPTGCPFRTRCALAHDRCVTERPVLRMVGTDRMAACHVAEEVSR
ncbi:ABC transporter ATP-binding protein [Microlunatus sp. GCM10028923]|uniref:ABC transporter ATP-binding protein n=1 Tax=Microlunatus sp. GCM10028923 TaxID=3273400 RepID=UPI00360F05DD